MRKHAPVLAALATSMLMVSCAADPAGAKEQTTMSAATQGASAMPFHDPAIVPLAEAVARGDVARIRALAPATDLSAHGEDDVTLLEWAIWSQKPAALAALLEAGADATVLGMDHETVAHMAAMVNDPEYLQVLIDHGAPVDIPRRGLNWSPIFRAVESGRDAQVDMLIAAGVDLHRTDSMGDSLLHLAADINDAHRVLQLLEAGVDPRQTNHSGATFQASLFAGSDARLNAKGKADRQKVREWLAAHGVPQQ
ncbi:MAG TPA: ankyrin repeat domain-containing protein [Luteimonas sp.]|nr:ankyrin repeat domain-containing protein [Luteimonas sp.]